jgi:hypothetical protein
MTRADQYLRLQLGDASYLLPSDPSFVIEPRENLSTNKSDEGQAVAWRVEHDLRLPVFYLDANLRAIRNKGWRRAVFLNAAPQAVGLAVDEAQLLPSTETVIIPFVPPGPAPTRLGHLFSGAWVTGNSVMLVFEPTALAAYLQSLGDE